MEIWKILADTLIRKLSSIHWHIGKNSKFPELLYVKVSDDGKQSFINLKPFARFEMNFLDTVHRDKCGTFIRSLMNRNVYHISESQLEVNIPQSR